MPGAKLHRVRKGFPAAATLVLSAERLLDSQCNTECCVDFLHFGLREMSNEVGKIYYEKSEKTRELLDRRLAWRLPPIVYPKPGTQGIFGCYRGATLFWARIATPILG